MANKAIGNITIDNNKLSAKLIKSKIAIELLVKFSPLIPIIKIQLMVVVIITKLLKHITINIFAKINFNGTIGIICN